MIGTPHNDHACLDALTDEIVAKVQARDPELLAAAEEASTLDNLIARTRTLPQRDDLGVPSDGPKVDACSPPQRFRWLPSNPNCVERAGNVLALAQFLDDPNAVWRLATSDTPDGMHTFPTRDGVPVVLDPIQTRNALNAGLWRIERPRNAGPWQITPTGAIEWISELAEEPAERFPDGPRRTTNARRAMRAVLLGRPLCFADVRDVAFVLALADREARLYGLSGPRIVRTTARALGAIDDNNARRWSVRNARRAQATRRNLRIGHYRVEPDTRLMAALGRVGGRLGTRVGVEALKVKLAEMGVTPPVLNTLEQELRREGLSLGPFASPPPMLGSLGALAPEALAGRWLAQKL